MATELDLDDLTARATAAAQDWAPGCTVTDVQTLTGGTSSLTFTAAVNGGPADVERVVLKVAPPGLEPVRNRDVARQARLMRLGERGRDPGGEDRHRDLHRRLDVRGGQQRAVDHRVQNRRIEVQERVRTRLKRLRRRHVARLPRGVRTVGLQRQSLGGGRLGEAVRLPARGQFAQVPEVRDRTVVRVPLG